MYDYLFSRLDYSFDIAKGVTAAQQFPSSGSYGLILTEFQLRDGTGEDFGKMQDISGSFPLVIVVTSCPEHESFMPSSKRMKFGKCFAKFFEPDALPAETERLLT